MGEVFLNRVGTAVPGHEVHQAFVDWAEGRLVERRDRAIFRRMVSRSGIERRWSVLPPAPDGGSPNRPGGFYGADPLPSTAARMAVYARAAPELALAAIAGLGPLGDLTHIVVASCTGFTAPGIDQIIARRLGLAPTIERTLVGFMGCYAAVAALRLGYHIVRSTPAARVLVVCVELCSLHLQDEGRLETLLGALQFCDGAGAAILSSERAGFAIRQPFAATLPDSHELIQWAIGDTGFQMELSGEVPGRIALALADPAFREAIGADEARATAGARWAVHAGGRSILDAVENGLALDPGSLEASRAVLRENGNMSSATLMFVLAALLDDARADHGVALAFGPGLAAEGFRFARA